MLFFGLYEKDKNGMFIVVSDYQLYYLIYIQLNVDMIVLMFWQVFMVSMLLYGVVRVEKWMVGCMIILLILLVLECILWWCIVLGVYEWYYNDLILGMLCVIVLVNQWEVLVFILNGIDGLLLIFFGVNVFGVVLVVDKVSVEIFINGFKLLGLVMMDLVLKFDQCEDICQYVDKVKEIGGVMVMEKGVGFQ